MNKPDYLPPKNIAKEKANTMSEYYSPCHAKPIILYKKTDEFGYIGICSYCGEKIHKTQARIKKEEKYKPLLTRLYDKDINFQLYLLSKELKKLWDKKIIKELCRIYILSKYLKRTPIKWIGEDDE